MLPPFWCEFPVKELPPPEAGLLFSELAGFSCPMATERVSKRPINFSIFSLAALKPKIKEYLFFYLPVFKKVWNKIRVNINPMISRETQFKLNVISTILVISSIDFMGMIGI